MALLGLGIDYGEGSEGLVKQLNASSVQGKEVHARDVRS